MSSSDAEAKTTWWAFNGVEPIRQAGRPKVGPRWYIAAAVALLLSVFADAILNSVQFATTRVAAASEQVWWIATLDALRTSAIALLLVAILAGLATIGLDRKGLTPQLSDLESFLVAQAGMFAAALLVGPVNAAFEWTAENPAAAGFYYPFMILAGVEEEVVAAGLAVLLIKADVPSWAVVTVLVAFRVAMHLHLGPGGAIATVVWSAVMAAIFLRTGRVLPLVLAHSALNILGVPLPMLLIPTP